MSVRPHGLQPTSLLRPWDFPGKSSAVGCHHLLQKEVEDDTNKWKDMLYSLMKGINIVKMSTLPKEIYRLYAIPFKILMAFFTELEQETFKCKWNHKGF